MSNPYAAKSVVHAHERTGELDTIIGRLRTLGATAAEIEDFVEVWDEPWDEDLGYTRDDFIRFDDRRLVRELAAARASNMADAAVDDDGYLVPPVPDGTVSEVLAWVGDGGDDVEQRGRARAALADENERENPRTTLVGALEQIIG